MALDRITAEQTAANVEQATANTKKLDEQATFDKLTTDIAGFETDLRSLRGDEKDAMKAFIKVEKSKLNNARVAVSQADKALQEIGDRLEEIGGRLETAQGDFDTKKAQYDANVLAIKEETRAGVVDEYNRLDEEINSIND
jgi:predicted  nucleic acid-binding Zn-ribbon protein